MKLIKAFFTTLFILAFAGTASAHTGLSTTNPEDGSEVTEAIDSISLTYSGQIEEGSSFEVLDAEGTEVSVNEFTVTDGVLTGNLENPLENGEYTVNWNSISEDGHPLEGTFGFTVNAPVEEVITTGQSESTEEVETTNTMTEEADETSQATEVASSAITMDQQESSPLIWVIAALAVVLVAVSIFAIARRKKA
ncbi:cobalt transporter [Chryseomicrobium excrementi]|uniref:Cobalt transporter n=1 Tax=Chryseomicrobium excrementi TaxID=2041346 RepID=A0A2M9EYG4_9BACL|nr:copper resistance CopC family protein [Chryseomicrobium excrementi]PJK16257.1 cobalt transporter [Chryseomicrobium excrementi]